MTPSGFYHVSWAAPGNLAAQINQQKRDLIAAAAAGMTLMACSHLQSIPATTALLNTAQQRGMALIIEDVPLEHRAAFAQHPALLAFSVADDANRKTPAELAAHC